MPFFSFKSPGSSLDITANILKSKKDLSPSKLFNPFHVAISRISPKYPFKLERQTAVPRSKQIYCRVIIFFKIKNGEISFVLSGISLLTFILDWTMYLVLFPKRDFLKKSVKLLSSFLQVSCWLNRLTIKSAKVFKDVPPMIKNVPLRPYSSVSHTSKYGYTNVQTAFAVCMIDRHTGFCFPSNSLYISTMLLT